MQWSWYVVYGARPSKIILEEDGRREMGVLKTRSVLLTSICTKRLFAKESLAAKVMSMARYPATGSRKGRLIMPGDFANRRKLAPVASFTEQLSSSLPTKGSQTVMVAGTAVVVGTVEVAFPVTLVAFTGAVVLTRTGTKMGFIG